MLFSMVKLLLRCCLRISSAQFLLKIESRQKIMNFLRKFLFFILQRGSTWGWPGGPTTLPRHSSARQGCGLRPPMARAPPGPPKGESPLSLPLSQPNSTQKLKPVFLLFLSSDFSISLLSPFQLLKLGLFALRYVTPPCIQVELCSVLYF